MSLFNYQKNELVDDSFQAFLVSEATFTSVEEYPIIPEYMVPKEAPKKIMPFNKAITYKGDLSDVYICTYAPDKSFERIRRNPKKYENFFKRTAGIIGFDFSVHSDMPIIKQKSQMNDNLSLTYYYGKLGNKVIPNLRCGVDELIPEFLQCFPKNSLIAIGVHGFHKYKFEKYEWYCFIEIVISELNPSGIIVYGDLPDNMFDDFKGKTEFFYYTPWIYENGRGGNKNGN